MRVYLNSTSSEFTSLWERKAAKLNFPVFSYRDEQKV
jgi:hypothetical protein